MIYVFFSSAVVDWFLRADTSRAQLVVAVGTDKSGLKDTDANLFLNIIEMSFAPMVHSLQTKDLVRGHPTDIAIKTNHLTTLNGCSTCPLKQLEIRRSRFRTHWKVFQI